MASCICWSRPAHEELSNFWLIGSQRTIVAMFEPKIDVRAYYYDRFYRHGVFKSESSCLRFTPDYGHFRRHDDDLKRLPCLQLKFQSSLVIGMMADFSVQRACTRKFHMTSDRHDDGFQHPTCLCCIFLKLSHDDDWVVSEKCCIIWVYFFHDANTTLQSRLIFVGIIFIFCRFDAAS